MIIGTTNPGKVREIASICAPLGLNIETLVLDVPEEGDTFEANAESKARGYSQAAPGQYVLVEDSGLVIPVLDGLPGPWSARFSDLNIWTHQVTESGRLREEIDPANNLRVLSLMWDIPFEKRAAYFIVCFIVAKDKEIIWKTSTTSHGWISEELRGTNGFGYDPIFIGNDTFGKTYAELDSARKNLRSHRNAALRQFEAWVANQVASGVSL